MKLPWRQKDTHHNGRVLFVDEPSGGEIVMGIDGVYTKYLSSAEARRMAKALLAAAEANDRYVRPTPPSDVAYPTTNGFTMPPAWLAEQAGV